MTSLLKNRKSLHRQIDEAESQIEAAEARLSQLQSLANLGMAWAMTAHELNNLLTPITNYAQVALQNPQDTAFTRKALEKTLRLGTQAGQMLEKVMTLANSEPAAKQEVALSTLLEDVLGAIGRDFSKDQIKLVFDFDKNLNILADANSLRQVLMNLMLNARHSMRQNGGTLRITAVNESEWTRLEITDTGCGIAPEKLRNIFTPFYTDGKKNGNGLGLAFCQKIIESHGGCISVDSQLGQGTHFRILLPRAGR